MTANQIAYWRNVETERANRANEALTGARDAETARSNMARESENYRSNTTREVETERGNRAQESLKNTSNLLTGDANAIMRMNASSNRMQAQTAESRRQDDAQYNRDRIQLGQYQLGVDAADTIIDGATRIFGGRLK